MKASDIVIALPSLTEAERTVIKLAIEGLEGADKGPASPKEGMLFDALCKAVNVAMPYSKFQTTAVHKHWKKAFPQFIGFIEETFEGIDRPKVTEMAVMRFMMDALILSMREGQIPITVSTVVYNLNRMPQVFETAFPFYRESGLAGMILNNIINRA